MLQRPMLHRTVWTFDRLPIMLHTQWIQTPLVRRCEGEAYGEHTWIGGRLRHSSG